MSGLKVFVVYTEYQHDEPAINGLFYTEDAAKNHAADVVATQEAEYGNNVYGIEPTHRVIDTAEKVRFIGTERSCALYLKLEPGTRIGYAIEPVTENDLAEWDDGDWDVDINVEAHEVQP